MTLPFYVNAWDIDPYFFQKSADESKTVDANEDDAHLTVDVPSGNYKFIICLEVGAGTGIKCGFRFTSSAFNFFGLAWRKDSGTGNLVMERTGITVSNIAASSAFYWTGKVFVPEGTFAFQWSRNTASGTSTVNADSWFHLKLVG